MQPKTNKYFLKIHDERCPKKTAANLNSTSMSTGLYLPTASNVCASLKTVQTVLASTLWGRGNWGQGWEMPVTRAHSTPRGASAADIRAQHAEQTVTGGSMTATAPTRRAQTLTGSRQLKNPPVFCFWLSSNKSMVSTTLKKQVRKQEPHSASYHVKHFCSLDIMPWAKYKAQCVPALKCRVLCSTVATQSLWGNITIKINKLLYPLKGRENNKEALSTPTNLFQEQLYLSPGWQECFANDIKAFWFIYKQSDLNTEEKILILFHFKLKQAIFWILGCLYFSLNTGEYAALRPCTIYSLAVEQQQNTLLISALEF